MAAVLSCIDSRTSNELIFDMGIGDIFSVRVAGNVVNDDVLASLEYSVNIAGSKLIAVIGHTNCGAISSAIDGVQLGTFTQLLERIQPSIQAEKETGESRTIENKVFVKNVTRNHVLASLDEIPRRSAIISEMLASGSIKLVGGIYDLETGRVEFLEHEPAV